jgi:hypothetical protein
MLISCCSAVTIAVAAGGAVADDVAGGCVSSLACTCPDMLSCPKGWSPGMLWYSCVTPWDAAGCAASLHWVVKA